MIAKLYALAGVCALAVTGGLYADACRTPLGHQVYPAAFAPGYHAPPAVLPLYGASYTGESDAEIKDLLKALVEQNKAILAELQGLRSGGGGGALTAKGGLDPAAILTRSCVACHTAGKAKGDFELADDKGQVLKLNGPDRRAIAAKVRTGDMPPKPALLTTDEKAALEAFAAGK